MNERYEDLPEWLAVSRETFDDLQDYGRLVEKWNPAVNLVSKAAMADLWNRHILDSTQVFTCAAELVATAKLWCDMGSGGGFPGLVVAIQAKHTRPGMKVVLIESDRRKAVFLGEVARQLGLNVTVVNQRIADIPPMQADVVSARGLAALDALCGYAALHLRKGGAAVFPKGTTVADEIDKARLQWQFKLTSHASHTDPSAKILILEDVHRVE